ncbi:MAG: PEP-CTERM sorting domain-containing protein [Phormidesmis priestleyi]|uniref:PEP-CTERM sorting domain-containing protein n=1 Tax=Phormidesmis priestleyi TaxID=268141 RepID=A0A2W4ZCD2_9CYAN|nr:MAG: PEP-CTERM sorting domain-containing protein [Phormidesmis priestleyi]
MKRNNLASISGMASTFIKQASIVPFYAALSALALTTFNVEKAQAATIVLDFEGLQNLENVNGFYNGGSGSQGNTGTNFGIEFSSNSLAIVDADAGGTGNFGGEPSPDTILFFLSGGAAVMNVAAGFDTGFSFFYSAINNPGTINVYDGLNGMGNILATLNLPTTPFNGAPDPMGQFSPFVPFGVGFTGIAKSVDFGGVVNQIGFDNITLGAATPGGGGGTPASVPEPGSVIALLLIGGASASQIKRQAIS